MKMKVLCVILSATPLIGLGNARASNIIDSTYGAGSGSFELGNFSANFVPPSQSVGVDRLSSSSTAITGWKVGPQIAGIDWTTAPDQFASDGTKAIDLCGANGVGDGSLSTIIPTLIGQDYHITFDAFGGNETQSGSLTAGSLLNQIFTVAGVAQTLDVPITYSHMSYDFIATGTSTTVSFASVNSDGYGPVMDNVVISAAPEPSSLALFAIGGIALLRRRRSMRDNAV